jgi:hypoxanthine phosphoribosyltransferase
MSNFPTFAPMQKIKLFDKEFEISIPNVEIEESIKEQALLMSEDHVDKEILFVAVLNGSFMYAAELMKNYTGECKISFVKLASYHGTSSKGSVDELIGLTEDVEDKDIMILEDIVDTGSTLEKVVHLLKIRNPRTISVATMLFKPDAYKKDIPVNYAAIIIPNDFIVGYGLDYDGLGRNLKDIYKISN